MLLSFVLDIFSRQRHSLLMKGIAWLGRLVVYASVCIFASVNNNVLYLCVSICPCVYLMCVPSAHVSVCVNEAEKILGIPALDWGAWQYFLPQPLKVRVCLPWRPYYGLSQFAQIANLHQISYVMSHALTERPTNCSQVGTSNQELSFTIVDDGLMAVVHSVFLSGFS